MVRKPRPSRHDEKPKILRHAAKEATARTGPPVQAGERIQEKRKAPQPHGCGRERRKYDLKKCANGQDPALEQAAGCAAGCVESPGPCHRDGAVRQPIAQMAITIAITVTGVGAETEAKCQKPTPRCGARATQLAPRPAPESVTAPVGARCQRTAWQEGRAHGR